MKKILSVVLVLSMVLALGVTAFAANPSELEAGKTYGFSFDVPTANGVVISDTNGILVFGEAVVGTDTVAVNVTAPAGTAGKVTKIVLKANDTNKTVLAEMYVTVAAPAEAPAPEAEAVIGVDDLVGEVIDNVAYVEMGEYTGISAAAYNALKAENFDAIVFVCDGYTWTLTRGDYTKMNVSASIYFGVTVSNNLYTLNAKNEVVQDTASENAVLKALGNTKADVFYVKVNDNVNIGNVASKPELVISVDKTWTKYNNKFSVTAYKFDGEAVAKVAEGLAVKPATGKMTLTLTAAGTYVFVADNHTVNPTPSTTEKPNASTGANNAAAAVVAMAVMAVAAVASKKIVK